MLGKLFTSKVRVELLKLFLFNSDNSFYQREISQRTAQSLRGVQRETESLIKIGLIEKFTNGNRVYYKLNKKCPIFSDLKKILFKGAGITTVLKVNLAKSDSISVAFIYGSYAKGQESFLSDIDLLVIGNITSRKLSSLLSQPKKELGREINYVVFPLKEFQKRLEKGSHFLRTILKEKKIFIVGSENELKTVTE